APAGRAWRRPAGHRRPPGRLQARADRLGLQRQAREHGLVRPPQRLAPGAPFERLHAQRALADGERALAAEVAFAQSLQIGRFAVLRPVDQTQVLGAAYLDARLRQPTATAGEVGERFDHHALTAVGDELLPPLDARGPRVLVHGVHHQTAGRNDEVGRRLGEPVGDVEVPGVVAVVVGR